MAIYKYRSDVEASESKAFDNVYSPGEAAPYSGIYRCAGCGREVTSEEGQPLPPQNHHQHTASQGAIRWRLTVYADHKAKAA